ncbi:hypothetical protein EVAR_25709_1 [Eumeta japonica]|uniref:Uncharacterized protein n=1 Tax=Eumeta variegata TaxID=151549 RepID=A0A4C1YTS2_EUMVA|nr:hypothetical protein EVAR_25709_1 [Eumeta japonica]
MVLPVNNNKEVFKKRAFFLKNRQRISDVELQMSITDRYKLTSKEMYRAGEGKLLGVTSKSRRSWPPSFVMQMAGEYLMTAKDAGPGTPPGDGPSKRRSRCARV